MCTVALLTALNAAAQTQVDDLMYRAYLSRDAEKETWQKIIKTLTQTVNNHPADKHAHFNLAYARLGLLTAAIKTEDEDWFDEHYKETHRSLEKAIKLDKQWAEPYAVQGAIYGLKIGFSPMQGMFLGPKSSSLLDKAKAMDPKSALAWKVYANGKFFTPEMWGGDTDEAIKAYETAIALYEQDKDALAHNWMYLDALAFLGQAYQRKGNPRKAIATYEKALAVEPQFEWVKNVLLPQAHARQ